MHRYNHRFSPSHGKVPDACVFLFDKYFDTTDLAVASASSFERTKVFFVSYSAISFFTGRKERASLGGSPPPLLGCPETAAEQRKGVRAISWPQKERARSAHGNSHFSALTLRDITVDGDGAGLRSRRDRGKIFPLLLLLASAELLRAREDTLERWSAEVGLKSCCCCFRAGAQSLVAVVAHSNVRRCCL